MNVTSELGGIGHIHPLGADSGGPGRRGLPPQGSNVYFDNFLHPHGKNLVSAPAIHPFQDLT